MAAGRKKLTGLLYAAAAAAAAAKQGRTLRPSLAQRSFFCSWLEGEHPPLDPPLFCNGEASYASNPHVSAQYLSLASATLTPSSLRCPLPSSLLPQAVSTLYCPNLDLPSLCQILYINDVKTPKQTDLNDASWTYENAHVHQHVLEKKEKSVKSQSPWLGNEVINWPNAISLGRLFSGPFLAWLIVEGLLQPAVVGLIISGASDWLDGYIARRRGIDSVFGTYLDPLADKVLIGCVALSMAHAGYLPPALVALVIARDAALIGGSFIHRAHNMKWQVSSLQDFFNVMNGSVQKVKPLYISKINTVFQLALVGVALIQPAFGIEDTYSLVPLLSWCVAFTTCASSVGYGWKLFRKSL